MGVVYKFKKEVIDFVLEQKRVHPELGCRQLAVFTSEKFKIQVSKSSVNAIIKNANLSQPVGRPYVSEPAPKKFQIPSQKKRQLLGEVQKVGFEKKPPTPSLAPSKPREKSFSGTMIPAREAFLGQVESIRSRRLQERGVLHQGMGNIFLKAAQWQIAKTSILGKLLRRYIPDKLPSQFDSFCNLLSDIGLSDFEKIDQIGQLATPGLLMLNGFDYPLKNSDALHWINLIKAISPSVKFSLEYEKEKQQLFLEVERFEFYLENDNKIVLDGQLASFWEDVAPEFLVCVEQAMAGLSSDVISNNHPSIFLSSGKQKFSSKIFDMMSAFEGVGGKQFKKVNVFDSSGDQIAEFSSFPHKKRIFMIGVWPWQEEFALLQNTKAMEPFYDELMDRIIYFRVGSVHLFQEAFGQTPPALRTISVFKSLESAPELVILTNEMNKPPKEMLQLFLRRWPNLDRGPAGRSLYAPGVPQSSFSEKIVREPVKNGQAGYGRLLDSVNIFHDWAQMLGLYCQSHFLGLAVQNDVSYLNSIYYNLPGYYLPQKDVLWVILCAPAGYSHIAELQLAIERVNEANITEPLGRKLILNLIK